MAIDAPTPHRRGKQTVASVDPPYLYPGYRSTILRAPHQAPLRIPLGPTELAGPVASALIGTGRADPQATDLTRQHAGEPLGQRIVVEGRVTDAGGQPIPGALVEVWQANAAGRYAHQVDQHRAPLDPNFTGAGACLTDAEGRYRFVTIKPGAYPWANHVNAWRPAHIHFSVLGRAFTERIMTQMYFPGDPLMEHDPIFNSIAEAAARQNLIAKLDLSCTVADWALGYRFDLAFSSHEDV
jgi:protocatechuate 3,4-dioxygenase beta subunit